MTWPPPISLIIFASVIAIDAPARAQPPESPAGVEIRFDDLDVRHTGGVRVLIRRIQTASARACGTAPDPRQRSERAAFDLCRARVADQIIRVLDAPVVRLVARPEPVLSG